jgi:TonB family protein
MGVVFTLVLLALNVSIASSPADPPTQESRLTQPLQELRVSTSDLAPAPRPLLPVIEISPKSLTLVPINPERRAAAVAQKQSGTAGIAGVVRDSDGGVMPGVTIALARGEASYTSTTNARGAFGIADVPAGAYEMTVSLRGFRTGQSRIELAAGETRRFDVHLKVGSVRETVTVGSPDRDEVQASTRQQVSANPQTAEEYLEAARMLFAQRRYDEGSRYVDRALELLRGEARASTIEEARPAVEGGPIRVGGSIREPKKIVHVSPIYPADALAADIQGIIILDAVIASDGSVSDVSVLRGVPILDQSAIDAVRQWRFTPTFLNGKPIEVAMTITVHFSR